MRFILSLLLAILVYSFWALVLAGCLSLLVADGAIRFMRGVLITNRKETAYVNGDG